MKIRSKPLYNYLLHAGVLHSTDEVIARAKQAYRKQYKRDWKRRVQQQKEIRYTVTVKQFEAIKSKAHSLAMNHTTYAKRTVLESVGVHIMVNDRLLEVLQLISMAAIALERTAPLYRIRELVNNAELKLLEYLNVE